MSAVIRGAKGGSAPHTPVESLDNLRSISFFRILDLVSEGEIGGLVNGQQSIFLDETPLGNAAGTSNFPKAHIEQRTGTQDQDAIPGFDSVENEISVGVELKSSAAWLHSVSDTTLSALRVTLGVPALSKANATNGDITGYSIAYKIEVSTDGGLFVVAYNGSFTGKTTTKFQRSHRIDLPMATTGWQVKVTRLTANANSSAIADVTTVDSYTEIVDAKLRYPNSAVIGVMGDASQFQNIPQRAYDLWGRIVKVPSNYNVTTRTYTGVWDGTFKPSWTDNPAWVFYDLVTHARYGLGHLITAAQVDKWELYKIGQYCDGMVSDGNGGTEPRLTCNIYLQSQADAYKLLNDLSTAFRGISYWANGAIVASADMPADPVYTYTDANVIEGKFSYSASARKTRFTTALVSWNDPRNFYRAKVEYVEDRDGIARYGIQQTEITAVGCASQGQAQRLGRWILLTSRLETDTVTFSVGLDGTLAAPGQIIRIADSARAGKRQGGRVHSATATVVTVDKAPTVAIGDTLTVIMSDGVSQTRTVSAVSGASITVSTAFTAAPAAQSMWVVESTSLAAQTFRVLSVTEDKSDTDISFQLTCLQHNAGKFDAVDNGTIIQVPPISALKVTSQPGPTAVSLTSIQVVGAVGTHSVMSIAWTAVAGAVSYEGAWRKDDGEWQPIGGALSGLSVDIVGTGAGGYVARIRAKGTGNAYSLFTLSNPFTVADNSTLPTGVAAIGAEAVAAQADANAANATLADIASDNLLTPGEKPVVIRDTNVITTEQAGIDAQATAYGITTQKTAYDTAVSALTSYLATLTAPVLWSNLTGNTTIVGATFRSKFADVYTTRQALLNAIYAAAKSKADAAQGTANTAVGQVTQLPVINGGFDMTPTGYGWVSDAGTFSIDTSGITPGVGTNCARRNANATADAYRNSGRVSVQIGQVVKSQGLIKAVGANGLCCIRISWLDASQTEITTTNGNTVTGTTTNGSYVVGIAPSGAFYARTEILVTGHTAGYYLIDNVLCSQYPSNIDEVPDGVTNARTLATRVSAGNPLIDFSAGYHLNKNVDNVADGSTYGRPLNSRMNANRPFIDFADSFQLNKNLGNIADGGGYSRVNTAQVKQGVVTLLGTGRNTIANPTFTQNFTGTVNGDAIQTGTIIDHWTAVGGSLYSYALPYNASLRIRTQAGFAIAASPAATNGCYVASDQFAVQANAKFALNINLFTGLSGSLNAGLTAYHRTYLNFLDSSGATVSNAIYDYNLLSAVPIIVTGTVPAGAVSCICYLTTFILNTGGATTLTAAYYDVGLNSIEYVQQAAMDTDVADGATYGRTAQADLYSSGGVNRVGLRIPGSGQRVGDQRNLLQRTVTNIPSKVGSTISYSASAGTPATATISVGSFTVLAGSVSVSYNASSASVTGTSGTNSSYYLYMNDPGYAGGTQTLVATTTQNDLYSGDGYVYIGYVTVAYPTSGSGSGGGIGCPQVDEPVIRRTPDGSHEVIRAGDVRDDDYLWLSTGRWGCVSYSEAKLQPCVRITGSDGSTITCSTSAPLETDDGTCMPAPSVGGLVLRHRDSGVMRIDDVAEIGDAWVQHITCEDACFWVGMYSHHNLKPP